MKYRYSLFAMLVLAILIQLSSNMLYAQQKVQRPLMPSSDTLLNYLEASKQYNTYYDQLKKEILLQDPTNPNPLRCTGYNNFKREEWFWRTRVDSTGNFPPADYLDRAYQHIQQQKAVNQKNPELAQSAWRELGPFTAKGGYYGMGRVMRIVTEPGTNGATRWWACTARGGVWRTTNGGTSWSAVGHTSLPILSTSDLAFDPDFATNQTVYLASGDYVHTKYAGGGNSVGILKSTNGGTTWTATGWSITSSTNWQIARLLINSQTKRLIAAASAIIRYSDNGGTTWSDATGITWGTVFRDMMFKADDQTVLVASTSDGRIFRSTNSGTSWTMVQQIPTNAGRVALATSLALPNRMYAVVATNTDYGLHSFWRSDDAGATWRVVYQPTTFSSATPNILSGILQNGQVSSSTRGQGFYDLCCAVSPSNANLVIVGGVNSYRSTNGGTTWTQISHWNNSGVGIPEVHADFHTLNYVSPSLLLIGNDGGVYLSSNDGTSFIERNQGLSITQFYRLGVSATAPSSVLAGAQDNSSWLLTGSTWTNTASTGDGGEQLISWANPNEMYTASQNGAISRSTNGGNSWDRLIRNDSTNQNEEGNWVTPYVQHPLIPKNILVGKQNLWEWNGASWTNKSNDQISPEKNTIEIVRYAPSAPTTIYVIKNGFLWVTTNDGVTWTRRTKPNGSLMITNVDIHPTDANRIWVTVGGFDGGRVYASNDAGSTWTDYSTNLPQISMNTILVQSNAPERLYVGHDAGIHYRDNSTNGWQPLMTNLPNVPITEIEAQYTAGVLRASTYGRGVWETNLLTASGSLAALSLSQSAISIGSPAWNSSVSITSNVSWTASSNQSWLTVSPPSGSNNNSLTLTASSNTGASSRNAVVMVSGGGVTQQLTITQSGSSSALSLSQYSVLVGRFGGNSSVSITSNVGWTASSNQSWLTVSPSSGSNNSNLTITASPNIGASPRSAVVTVSGGGLSQQLDITQSGASPTLTLSEYSVSVGSGEETGAIDITSNVGWTASSNQSWLTISPSSGSGDRQLLGTVSRNTSLLTRVAVVTVSGVGVSPQRLTVTQSGFPAAILLSQYFVSAGSERGSASINITSNVSWTASSNQSWLTISPLSGNGNGELAGTVSENTGTSSRTAEVTVSGIGVSPQKVTITQSGYSPTLSISENSLSVGSEGGSGSIYVTSNVRWTASSNQSWLTLTPSSNFGNGDLSGTVSANTGTSSRTAVVTVSGDGVLPQQINITQLGTATSVGSRMVQDMVLQVVPNPVEQESRVEFWNARAQVVRIEVMNALGQRVALIADGQMSVGKQSHAMPKELVSGMYYVRVSIGSEVAVVPVVVMK